MVKFSKKNCKIKIRKIKTSNRKFLISWKNILTEKQIHYPLCLNFIFSKILKSFIRLNSVISRNRKFFFNYPFISFFLVLRQLLSLLLLKKNSNKKYIFSMRRKIWFLTFFYRRLQFKLACSSINLLPNFRTIWHKNNIKSFSYFISVLSKGMVKLALFRLGKLRKSVDFKLLNIYDRQHRKIFNFSKKRKIFKKGFYTKSPSAFNFSYLGSRSSKTTYNRARVFFLEQFYNFLFNFSSIYSFGIRRGLNFNRIGFWRLYGSIFAWREFYNNEPSEVYYRPARSSWRKMFLKTFYTNSFLLTSSTSYYAASTRRPTRIFKATVPSGKTAIYDVSFNYLKIRREPISLNKNHFSLIRKLNLDGPRSFLTDKSTKYTSTHSNLFSKTNSAARFNRFFDKNFDETFNQELFFLDEFVYKKKDIRGLVVNDRHDIRGTFVKSSAKYHYYYYRCDPMANSYFLDKVISVFSRGSNKKFVRNIFYRLFFSINSEFTISMLYCLIESLKPTYINVKVRRGKEHYEAPILASNFRAVMKAIKFFKKAVMARQFEESLFSKVRNEVRDFFCWSGYENEYYENYISVSKKNMHLRHFRSATRY